MTTFDKVLNFDGIVTHKKPEKTYSFETISIETNPYVSMKAFHESIMKKTHTEQSMFELIQGKIDYIINNIITDPNSDLKSLISNPLFIKALIRTIKTNPLNETNKINLNRIIYEYIAKYKNPTEDIIQLSYVLDSKDVTVIQALGFDTNTSIILALAKNSSPSDKVTIHRVNNVLLSLDPDITTVSRIKDLYIALYNLKNIFNEIMFNIRDEKDDRKIINTNISLALIEVLNTQLPGDIYSILYAYAIATYTNPNVRFLINKSNISNTVIGIIETLRVKSGVIVS